MAFDSDERVSFRDFDRRVRGEPEPEAPSKNPISYIPLVVIIVFAAAVALA